MPVPQLCCVALALLALFIWSYATRRNSSRRYLAWHILGLLPSLGRIHDWLTDRVIQNGGTARLHGPWKSRILTADTANIDYVIRTKFCDFQKGDFFKDVFGDLIGDSLLLQGGERFRQLNKSIARAFASAGFRNTAVAVIPTAVHQKLLPLLRQGCHKGTVIDLQDVFLRFAFDNVCAIGFGIDPGSLSSDFPRVPLLDAYEGAIDATMLRTIMPAFCWKTMRYFSLGPERRLRRARQIVYTSVDEVMARWASADWRNSARSDFMSILVRNERENGRHCSNEVLRPLFLDLILAGKDTIKAALSWFFWLLAEHPSVEEKILAELRHIIKQRPDAVGGDKYNGCPFRLEELKQMHYLHAALTESLRLYPPTPIEILEALKDDVLPDGTVVEKGSQVFYSIYACGRQEKVWGEDCRKFKPERWLKDGRFVMETDFKFVVFNGGPRRCTGREFAYWQLKWVTASIILRYRVKMVNNHPVLPKFSLSLAMKHGLLVTIQPRADGHECLETLNLSP